MTTSGQAPTSAQTEAWESVLAYASKTLGVALRALDDQLMKGPVQRAIVNALSAKTRVQHEHAVAQWNRSRRLIIEHMARIDVAMNMLTTRRDFLDGVTPDVDPQQFYDQMRQGAQPSE